MKKIFLILLIILTGSQFVKADNTPAITIEFKYVNASDTTHFVKLKSDNEFCCNFIVTSSFNSKEDVTLLKHTKTGIVLGTFYGRPSKEFIMDICKKMGYLDQKNVDKVAESMLKMKNN
jgi:carbonic anhydrase